MPKTLYSPTGIPILGTLEKMTGCALVSHATRNPDGSLEFEYEGETKIYWDDQQTVTRNGQTIWLDEDGGEWPASTLVLKADCAECGGAIETVHCRADGAEICEACAEPEVPCRSCDKPSEDRSGMCLTCEAS